VKNIAHFLWWLGPWADSDASPQGATRTVVEVPTSDGVMEAHWYLPPGPARGTWILAPGLTFRGIDDPRFERFARILAGAGLAVFAPGIPDFRNMTVTAKSIDDFQRAFDVMWDLPDRPPGRPAVWSISTGSVMALRLAANPDYAYRIGGLVTWGGYGAWRETVQFCLTGHDGTQQVAPKDRGLQPVTYINLLDHVDGTPADGSHLLRGWREYVRLTWYEEMDDHELDALAIEMQEAIPVEQRQLFLDGCGVGGPESMTPALAALEGDPKSFAHLDAVRFLEDIRCPVYVIHAADDTVVAANQRFVIANGLSKEVPVQVHLTGLYGHSSAGGTLDLRQLATAANELKTLFHVAWAAAKLPTLPQR
jgi:hypothetical protein